MTAGTALLDSSGRRIVVQDASGAIEVLLPSGYAGAGGRHEAPRSPARTGRAWGAPRIAASSAEAIGSGGPISPLP